MSFTMSGAAVPVVMTFFGSLSFVTALYLLWMMLWRPRGNGQGGGNGGDGDGDDGKDKKM